MRLQEVIMSQSLSKVGKAALVVAAPVAAFGAFYAGMNAITELYSKKVWATPEEQRMTLPGDDLVVDPNGNEMLRITQAKDLDAPLEEVWKHLYQADSAKAGCYSWVNFERLFGMNVNNTYTLQGMWQAEDATKPGDFWSWGFAGYGGEIADLVPNKYIVWYADSRDPTKTPGATFMCPPGTNYCIWNWTIALMPLDSGKRCRIIGRFNIAFGPHSVANRLSQRLIICQGGALMARRMFENLELSARVERRKSLPLRAIQSFVGGNAYSAPKQLQHRIPFPDLQWSRAFPRVAAQRAPFTDDPNWPPAPGTEYVPPIQENNEKMGWTPETPARNNRLANEKQNELLRKLGMENLVS